MRASTGGLIDVAGEGLVQMADADLLIAGEHHIGGPAIH